MQLVPSQLVPIARQALAQQGYDPNILKGDGSISEIDLVTLAFDKVEIRTSFGSVPPFDLKTKPNPKTQATLRRLQPAIILTGRAGRVEIAPYGLPSARDP